MVALVDNSGCPTDHGSSPRATAGYSHLGRLTEPLEIADGGYITFVDPANGDVWQRFRPGRPGAGQELGTAGPRSRDAARARGRPGPAVPRRRSHV